MSISSADSQLDINLIIENIKKEALSLKLNEPLIQIPVRRENHVNLQEPEDLISTPFVIKRNYHIEEFLRYDDAEFVKNAYKGVLQREVDDEGFDSALVHLRNGGGRKHLLVILLLSEEGQKSTVRIKGLRSYKLLYRVLSRLGFVGRTLLGALSAYVDPEGQYTTSVRLTATEQRLVANQKRLFASFEQELVRLDEKVASLTSVVAPIKETTEACRREQALVRQDLRYQQRNVETFLKDLSEVKSEQLPNVRESYSSKQLDAYYIAFEDACRGTREEIRDNLKVYLPYLGEVKEGSCSELLDLGCGRGEWLQLTQENGWQASGIDLNAIMIEACHKEGLTAIKADAVNYLKKLPDESKSVVTGFHIIEHLPFDALFLLFSEAMRVLEPGGKILFETPNPENLLVASHTFYHDPTHKNPVTPTAIKFLAQYHGFNNIEIIRLHPYPESAKVRGIDPLTERVNGHLCGPQDYAILAEKPKEKL